MKCPYRKKVSKYVLDEQQKQNRVYPIEETRVEFCDCYEDGCPWYIEETLKDSESCWKCEFDVGCTA